MRAGCFLLQALVQSREGWENYLFFFGRMGSFIAQLLWEHANTTNQWDFQAPPRTWDPLPIQASHTTPLRIPKDMGMVWVPLTRRGSCYWEFPWTKTGLDTGAFQSDQLKQHQNRISRFQTIFFVMFPMKIIMCFPSKETSVTCLSFLLNLVLLTKKWWLQPSLAATHCI